MKIKSKVENGEVIEEFRKRYWTQLIDDYGDEHLFDSIEAFITNALNQQRENIIKETIREGRWCQFCGDEMECFGCQAIPGRKVGTHLKLLLEKMLKMSF